MPISFSQNTVAPLGRAVLALLLLLSADARALTPIPDRTGVTGFVALGAGAASVESNFLAEAIGNDLGEADIDDLDAPGSQSLGLPTIGFELGYVFDGKTQLFVGNLLEDYLRFDMTTRLGVRQSLGNAGRVSLAAISSPLKVKVWENPYATGIDRDSTDRDTSGFRFSWDAIMGSNLEIRLTSRTTEIDDENSGVGIGLTQAQIDALDRNGDSSGVSIRHPLTIGETHKLIGTFHLVEEDLEGDAMSHTSSSIELNWIYTPDRNFRMVTNLIFGARDFDEDNPVFGEKADSRFRALSVTGFFPGLWGFREWVPNAALVVGSESSDIDFFDSRISIISIGFLNRF